MCLQFVLTEQALCLPPAAAAIAHQRQDGYHNQDSNNDESNANPIDMVSCY